MISRRNFLAAAGVVAAAGVLTACGGSSGTAASAAGSTAAAASGDTIKVGVMGPLDVYKRQVQGVEAGADLHLLALIDGLAVTVEDTGQLQRRTAIGVVVLDAEVLGLLGEMWIRDRYNHIKSIFVKEEN